MDRVPVERVNILVVDDRPAKLLAMSALLEDLGENVVCVPSGIDALRQLLERDFAVVLLDVNMPDMDGFETAALIRQRPRSQHVPIIFMTAGSDEAHALQGYSLGAVDYILTPVVPEVLRTKVKVFVQMFRMAEQLKQQAEQRVALAEERAARVVAEEASRRTAFLAEAGKSMARSLDLASTVEAILGVLVPDLTDAAVLRLRVSDEETVRSREREGGRATARWSGLLRESMDRAAASLATQVVRDGSPERAALGVACPLLARGAVLGVLAVVTDEARAPYDAAAVALMEDLSSRAAVAIDNCLLYQEIQQRDVRKDRFVAMLAHELRNPLGAITSALGVLEILGDGKGLAVQARGVIKRQLQSLTQLVDDLLDVARVTSGKITLNRSIVNLAESAERCVQTFDATGRTDGYTVTVGVHDTWIDVDATRLDQILGNLIGNALKYTPKGGRITVGVRPEGNDGVFEIADSGVGMSPEVLARVFDLFFQADRSPDRAQGGLGVGLTLVRQLVELHGGRVEAASAGEGRGSRFTVRLPRAAPAGAEEPGRDASPPHSARSRIVVIEDNKDAREMLGVLLSLEGHEVLEAVDGPTGVEVTEATEPDLVFVDVGLPGVDGYEVARRLRASPRGKDLFLIALTGYGQPEDRRKALEAGFDAHIVKPIDPNQLTAVIASARQPRHEESRRTSG